MKPYSNNDINTFRLISCIEGFSYLILVFIAMPLKYLYESPILMKIIGMAHGILFILFIVFLIQCIKKNSIKKHISLDYFIYSLTPFGFLLIEKMIILSRKF